MPTDHHRPIRIPGFIVVLITSIIFTSLAAVVGQDNDSVRLVDEFDPRVGCEAMEMRLDLLFAEVSNKGASSIAYVVIHQGDSVFDNAVVQRKAVAYARFRNFPQDQYSVILVRGSGDIRVQLWIGEKGKAPSVVASDLNLKIPGSISRTKVDEDTLELVKIDGRETYIGTGNPSCLYWFSPYIISEILEANDEFDAELLIKTKSSARYRKLVTIMKTEFQEAGAPVGRLKFVYGGRDKELEGSKVKLASVTTSFVRITRK